MGLTILPEVSHAHEWVEDVHAAVVVDQHFPLGRFLVTFELRCTMIRRVEQFRGTEEEEEEEEDDRIKGQKRRS